MTKAPWLAAGLALVKPLSPLSTMNTYYNIYVAVTFIAAGIMSFMAIYAWRQRNIVSGAFYFFWVSFVGAVWMTFWGLEIVGHDLAFKALANNIRYSFSSSIGFTFCLFVLDLCGWRTWLKPRRIFLLGLIPLLNIFLIWTNSFHHLVWRDYKVIQEGAFLFPLRNYGPWYSVQTSYNNLLAIFGILLICYTLVTQPASYRKQTFLILMAQVSIQVMDLIWILHLVPGPGLYPFSIILVGLFIAWALFRHQFLSIVPVAHHVVIRAINDGIIVMDTYKRVVAINPAALHLAGLTEAQAIGKPLFELLPTVFGSTSRVQNFAANEVRHKEIVYSQPDMVHIYDVQVSPLRDRQGIETGQIVVLRDITSRKQMEQALRASEERFRLLAENAKHVIFRLQLIPERRFDYLSPFVTTMTGYLPAEFYADPELHFKVVHPASRPLLLELKDVADHTVHTVILRYNHKEGHEIWVEQDQWAIYDQEGQRIAFEGVIRDITQRKLAEQQVTTQQEALTMLKERERLARELHDNLGQVLGYINLHAQGIRDLIAKGDEKEASHLTEQIIQVSQSVLTDIREYILGVQINTNAWSLESTLTTQPIFFAALEAYLHEYSTLAGLKATLQPLSDQQQFALGPTVETHLLRIIQEALSNVRKYAQATQVQVEFNLTAPSEDPASNLPWLVVTIQDDGQGFDLTNTPQHLPGQGYGLESMRSRAAECGGTLTIESAPQQGTCITVQLPLSKEQLARLPPIRVLLADDSSLFLSGMASLLTRQGFQVVGTANDGEEAVVQAVHLQPDIILMDIHMPHGGGLEATRLIKQNLPECQIIMLTVSEDEEHLFTAIKNGAAGYLLKNLDSAKLVALLRGLTQGEVPLAPGMATKILQEFARLDDHLQLSEAYNAPNLSNYEVNILKMVARGSTYKLIGDTMHLSERTVKRYVNAIVKKLRLKSRIEAIEYVRQKGLIP